MSSETDEMTIIRFAPLALALFTTPALAQPCNEIRFGGGMSTGTVQAVAPAGDLSVCYTIGVRPGQNVDLSVTGENVVMSVPGVTTEGPAFAVGFVTQASEYQVIVFQRPLGAVDVPFRLTLEIR